MGRANFDPLAVFRLDPAAEDAPAREDERVRAVVVDDGKLKVLIEGGGACGLPHRSLNRPPADGDRFGGWRGSLGHYASFDTTPGSSIEEDQVLSIVKADNY